MIKISKLINKVKPRVKIKRSVTSKKKWPFSRKAIIKPKKGITSSTIMESINLSRDLKNTAIAVITDHIKPRDCYKWNIVWLI